MITTLKVELEKVTPFREDLNGYRHFFISKLPFKDIQIDMPKTKDQSQSGDMHFHTNSFALRLALPQREKSTIIHP